MNKKLAVIDLRAAPLILAAAVIGFLEAYKGPSAENSEEVKKIIEGPIADELAELQEPGYSVLQLNQREADLSTIEGRAAELQAVHSELKRTLNRLDQLNGPRELSQAATKISDAFMLISPLIQDAKGEAVEPDLTPEEIEHAERGPATVHRNAGDGGVDAAPGLNAGDGKRVAAAVSDTIERLSLRERAEIAFKADAESKNWVQPDGKTPLVPFRDLPEEEKALWDAIVLEADAETSNSDPRGNPKVETLAKEIYATFEGASEHPWQDGGNSTMQDEARRAARKQLETSK